MPLKQRNQTKPYKFKFRCNSIYIGRTSQCLEVRVRQHVPRDILNSDRLASGHLQALDSDIGEHLLTINSCRTNNQDDWFSVLYRTWSKIHLNILEAIYIFFRSPLSLITHNLHILGNILGVT